MAADQITVLHLVHAFAMGGMENGIVNLASGLESRGVRSHVCALTTAGEFRRRLPTSSIVAELGKQRGFSVGTLWKLRKAVRTIRPQVIHSHNWTGLVYAMCSGLPQLAPVLHGEHAELYGWERGARRLTIRRWLYRFCARVHTVSSGQLHELQQLGIAPGDALALPNGVDTQRFVPSSKADSRLRLSLPDDAVVLGMVSRFIPEKQHSRLLDAFALQTDPRLHLMFVGDGGNIKADVLEKIARHPKRDRIHLLGERSDMPLVYPAMDLLVLPSDAEGMSNACLEAAACGVPALANACCGSAELIEDGITGRICTMTTANALAVALSDAVMTPGQLRAWGDSARSHIVKNFSLQSMLDRYTQLYLDLGAKCGQSKSTDAS